jgi:hypothetical protein
MKVYAKMLGPITKIIIIIIIIVWIGYYKLRIIFDQLSK